MPEYIDIVTKQGIPTGKSALKSDIHTKGYYHNTAHVWLFIKDGQVLLAQRAASKLICPLLWDVSVAGHVDAGETIAVWQYVIDGKYAGADVHFNTEIFKDTHDETTPPSYEIKI